MNHKLLELKTFGDERGALVALEQNKEIPFDIKRIYYIYDTKPNIIRGYHAHKNLEQVIICVNGSCKFKIDDGKEKKIYEINRPDMGLYIGKNLWREFYDFSHGCVLLVIANDFYNEAEYIRDYEGFLKEINSAKQQS